MKLNNKVTLCSNCSKEIVCDSCSTLTISQRFQNFSSGSEQLDEYLKNTHKRNQENPRNLPIFFIPFNEFNETRLIKKGGESSIHISEWKNGINGLGSEIVALKTSLDGKFDMKKFINELDLQSKIYGTNTPQVYGVTKDLNDKFMIVMEYAEFGDLRDYLSNNFNNLKFKDKLRMLKEIILAVKDIHSAGLVHGDVHPGNILRGKNSFYVSDLGLCRPYKNDLNEEKIFGVLPYVAPEVFLGNHYGPKSDIYGFGIVAWEILSGKKVYDDCVHDIDLIVLITTDGKRPPPINGTPLELWNLIQSCWNKDYTKRPTAKELYSKLVEWFLFDKIYEEWENDLKNGINEKFINLTIEDDYFHHDAVHLLNSSDINNKQYSISNSLSVHDRNPSENTSRNATSIISFENNEDNDVIDSYVSVQLDLTIPDDLSEN